LEIERRKLAVKTRRYAVAIILSLIVVAQASAQKKLSASEAKDHIGETATVCGNVVSTHYAARSKGNPTFLNFDEPYPRQIFTILIWGSDRPKFGDPETKYRNRRVCVTGMIKNYRGAPEIVADSPDQIKAE
jgi:DNA/RNA endonuclease YhcR with UshA esterase domain